MNKPKSTITISLNEQDQIEILINHDPVPSGERKTWSPPAQIADCMVREITRRVRAKGEEPAVEAIMNTLTGELDVTTRRKE